MAKEGDCFQHRQNSRPHGIECNCDHDKGQHNARILPTRKSIRGIGNLNCRLDLRCDHKYAACKARQPSQSRHPPRRIAQELLIFGGCELADPMILPTGGRCHGFHLGEGGYDGGVAEHRADKDPEEATEAAVDEASAQRDEDVFPSCRVDGHEAEGRNEAEVSLL